MKRTICLVIIFLLAQVLSSLVVLFFFNLSDLLHEGRLDVNALAASPSALGISLLLNGVVVWAVMTLLRWTDRKSFRFGQIKWPVYAGVVLWMLPVIFIVNLLLETLTLEDLNKDVFATLVYNPWGVLAIVLVGPVTEELVFRMGIQRHLIVDGHFAFSLDIRSHTWQSCTNTGSCSFWLGFGLVVLAVGNDLDSGGGTCLQ
mgnify:CR=1 FL=1